MKLSELKDGDASLVQSVPTALKLSDLGDDDAQLVSKDQGAARSGLDHFANAAAMGYLPQLTAAVGQLIPNPSADVDAKLRAQGFNISQPESSYLSDRDEVLSRLDQESKAHPYASAAGTVGGAIAGGAALGGLMPEIKGATLAARTLNAAKAGAIYGAASNPGDTAGEINPVQGLDRAKNAVVGGVVGGVMNPVVEGAAAGLNYLKGKFSNYAADKAAKAIGMTKADYKRLGPDGARDLGKEALGQRIVGWFATPAKVEATTDAMKEAAGKRIGGIIDDAQTQLDAIGPVGYEPTGRAVQVTPVQSVEKTGSMSIRPEPAVEPTGPTQDFFTPVKPVVAGRINAPALAQKLRAQGDAAELSKIPGMEGLSGKITGFLDTLEKNPSDMTLRQAQELRQGIDSAINWGKRVPDMAGTQQYLVNIRTALSDAMSNSVDHAAAKSGGALGALRAANKQYSTLSKINEIAANRNAMNAANRAFGLTDTIASGAGAGAGGTIGGFMAGPVGAEIGAGAGSVVGGGVNKFARTFGPALQANAANVASKAAGAGGAVAAGIGANQMVPQSLLQAGLRANPDQPVQTNQPILGDSGSEDRKPAAKGEAKWIQTGGSNLGLDADTVSRLSQSKQGKALLIQASDLPPGSPSLKRIQKQIGAMK